MYYVLKVTDDGLVSLSPDALDRYDAFSLFQYMKQYFPGSYTMRYTDGSICHTYNEEV